MFVIDPIKTPHTSTKKIMSFSRIRSIISIVQRSCSLRPEPYSILIDQFFSVNGRIPGLTSQCQRCDHSGTVITRSNSVGKYRHDFHLEEERRVLNLYQ